MRLGTRAATSIIKGSGLPRAHSECILEKVEVSGGEIITGTAVFSLGNREKPVHISRSGYLNQLQWISSKYFVLWDEGDKQGWLVRGSACLLHLLRASLEHSKQMFGSSFLCGTSRLDAECDSRGLDQALQILAEPAIRDLSLYMDKSEKYDEEILDEGQTNQTRVVRQTRYYRLQDRVDHIYNLLEKLIDHQTDAQGRSGVRINPRPRRTLEGWNFRDMVTDSDPFFPRVCTLATMGKGWVDFVRSIQAVTLFGRGYGELIQPKKSEPRSCPWSSVPKRRYYLAASILDLQQIMEEEGDSTISPRKLCDNVLWHTKQAAFQPCPCTAAGSASGHHDPVQALFPARFWSQIKKKSLPNLELQGAVIFGHSMNIHWYWGDIGDPVQGDLPVEDSGEPVEPPQDSGLGSSLNSSGGLSSNGAGESTPTIPSLHPTSVRTAPSTAELEASTPESSDNGNLGPGTLAGNLKGAKRSIQDMVTSMKNKKMRFQ